MSKKKIAFYISTKSINHADLSCPENGNPGIGATQYLFIFIASQLSIRFHECMQIILITDSICKLPPYLQIIKVTDVFEAVSTAKNLDVDLLVIRTSANSSLYNYIDDKKQKVLTWSHNRIWGDTANMISESQYVVRNICVGARQALELLDDEIYKKTEVIFNPVIVNKDFKRNLEAPIVTYIGHMDKTRGFHLLAKVWKNVLKEVPNAELYVIGSAALYDRNTNLGALGIASEKYEKKFIKYISDDNGNLLTSVHFLGIMGQEKIDIYKKTTVGVINPTGYETLGVSGLEMEACGIPIVTVNKYGQSEIVKNGVTGYLFNNTKQFKNYLVRLLVDKEINKQMGRRAKEYVDNKYNLETILDDWKLEFENILLEKSASQKYMRNIEKNTLEKFQIFNSVIKQKKHLSWIPAILEIKTFIRNIINRTIKKWDA